jgi:hypothetical protein
VSTHSATRSWDHSRGSVSPASAIVPAARGPRAREAREKKKGRTVARRGDRVALALCGEGFGTSRGIAEEAKARTQEEAYPVRY